MSYSDALPEGNNKHMRTIAVTSSILLAVTVLTACSNGGHADSEPQTAGGSPSAPQTFDVSGSIERRGACDSDYEEYFPDLREGAQVTVLNSGSEAVGLGDVDGSLSAPGGFGPCIYTFTVQDVPAGESDIYSLRIGSREPYQFTRAEASSLSLSLGD